MPLRYEKMNVEYIYVDNTSGGTSVANEFMPSCVGLGSDLHTTEILIY